MIPPTYRRVAVSVGIAVKPGYGVEAVRRWVELVLRQYLSPLPAVRARGARLAARPGGARAGAGGGGAPGGGRSSSSPGCGSRSGPTAGSERAAGSSLPPGRYRSWPRSRWRPATRCRRVRGARATGSVRPAGTGARTAGGVLMPAGPDRVVVASCDQWVRARHHGTAVDAVAGRADPVLDRPADPAARLPGTCASRGSAVDRLCRVYRLLPHSGRAAGSRPDPVRARLRDAGPPGAGGRPGSRGRRPPPTSGCGPSPSCWTAPGSPWTRTTGSSSPTAAAAGSPCWTCGAAAPLRDGAGPRAADRAGRRTAAVVYAVVRARRAAPADCHPRSGAGGAARRRARRRPAVPGGGAARRRPGGAVARPGRDRLADPRRPAPSPSAAPPTSPSTPAAR